MINSKSCEAHNCVHSEPFEVIIDPKGYFVIS